MWYSCGYIARESQSLMMTVSRSINITISNSVCTTTVSSLLQGGYGFRISPTSQPCAKPNTPCQSRETSRRQINFFRGLPYYWPLRSSPSDEVLPRGIHVHHVTQQEPVLFADSTIRIPGGEGIEALAWARRPNYPDSFHNPRALCGVTL